MVFPVNGSDRFDFIAYYPYKDSGTDPGEIDGYTYPVDVSDQTDQAAIDPLYAYTYDLKTNGYDKYDAEVVPSVGDIKGMDVTIRGMETEASFDLMTGTLGTTFIRLNITPLKDSTARNTKPLSFRER